MAKERLLKAVAQYLHAKGFKVQERAVVEGPWGVHSFDLLASSPEAKIAVAVKNWRKSVGADVLIRVDQAASEVGIPYIVVVGPYFSPHAASYALRRGNITLLTIEKLLDKASETHKRE